MRYTLKLSAILFFASLFVLSAGVDVFAGGNRYLPKLSGLTSAPTVGHTTTINLSSTATYNGCLVAFFASFDAQGTTNVRVANIAIQLPLGQASQFDMSEIQAGFAGGDYTVPNDPSLEGTPVYFIAVVLKNGALTATPVMPGGPILIDDLA